MLEEGGCRRVYGGGRYGRAQYGDKRMIGEMKKKMMNRSVAEAAMRTGTYK